MKLVYGGQVIENATVEVQPHNKPQRTKQLIELTVPADAQNGGYAVRQLLGQDPDIGAKSVVMLEVALTQQQIERLKNITEDELRDIRNGVNPAMIYGVRVYDSEPMDLEEFITGKKWPRWFMLPPGLKDAAGNEMICIRRDSSHSGETFCLGGTRYLWHQWHGDDLQLEEITEQEAQAIIAHSVKPSGEYLGCVQWFQHSQPTVIVRRDSHDRCTYFDQQLVTPDILWDYHMSQWVKSGQWTEITQQEAERRIEHNRTPAMQALRSLAEQQGIDPAGMEAKDIADRLIAANQRIAAETSSPQQTVERGFEQLPADRDAVIRLKELASAEDHQMQEFPVEQVDVPRAGIDQVSLIDSAGLWKKICEDNVWNKATWAARRHNFKIRCLPQHLPPVRNVAVLWPEPLSASTPDLAFVGVDYAKGPDISATVAVTTEPEQQIVELTMHSVLTPGCWVIAFSHKEHFVVEISTEQKLNGPIPAAKLSGPIGVKFPLRHRLPVMPKDYGRQVVCRDMENFSIYDVKTGTLQGFDPVKKVFMVADQHSNHTMYRRENEIWIIDEPTEGF